MRETAATTGTAAEAGATSAEDLDVSGEASAREHDGQEGAPDTGTGTEAGTGQAGAAGSGAGDPGAADEPRPEPAARSEAGTRPMADASPETDASPVADASTVADTSPGADATVDAGAGGEPARDPAPEPVRGAAAGAATGTPRYTRPPGMPPPPEHPDEQPGHAQLNQAVKVPGVDLPRTDALATPRWSETGSGSYPLAGAPTADPPAAGGAAPAGTDGVRPRAADVAAAVGSARVHEAVRATRAASGPRGPRRARLSLKRLDPWSVMKFSFTVSLVMFIVLLVASAVLYLALDTMGVFTSVNNTLGELIESGGGESGGFRITAQNVIGTAAALGALNVLLITALATLGAFIYNVCADLVGGVEVTLAERE